MNVVDRWRERLGRVDPQRWLLGGAAVAAAAVASLAAGSSGGGQSMLVSVTIVALAVAAAFRPTTHTALPVVLLVTWQWLATTDDALSPLIVAVAVTLIGFHALIALLAAVPPAAAIDKVILRRWVQRTAITAATALPMWGAVALMEQRDAPGSGAVTLLGFLVATALIGAMRWHRPRARERTTQG